MGYQLIEAIYAADFTKRVRVGVIISEFNQEITSKLLEGCLSQLTALGVLQEHITIVKVPGAVEIPLTAKLLAQHSELHGLIALGAVVRGETSHYDYVCGQVSEGCQQVMLEYSIPVVFGILTVDTEEQAFARLGGEHGHKGRDAADTALAMISVASQLGEQCFIS